MPVRAGVVPVGAWAVPVWPLRERLPPCRGPWRPPRLLFPLAFSGPFSSLEAAVENYDVVLIISVARFHDGSGLSHTGSADLRNSVGECPLHGPVETVISRPRPRRRDATRFRRRSYSGAGYLARPEDGGCCRWQLCSLRAPIKKKKHVLKRLRLCWCNPLQETQALFFIQERIHIAGSPTFFANNFNGRDIDCGAKDKAW